MTAGADLFIGLEAPLHPLQPLQPALRLCLFRVDTGGTAAAPGSAGADRFFATTEGWDLTILNDRAEPRYPRHQQLSADETAFVDERLAALGVRIVAAE